MLCRISISMDMNGRKRSVFLIEVPDALFMRHMMMYGDFKPEQLTDNEYASCTLLGLRDTVNYDGPADTPTERKDG